jgi:trehalose 6-phosphate synthase
MGRLIVASNRVGDFRSGFQAGGLAVALGEVMKASGGLWFGSTEVKDSNPDIGVIREAAEGADGVEFYRVSVGHEEYEAYYSGFANSVFWPVCHNRIDLAHFDNGFYKSYRRVNERFADAIAQRAKPDDIIWVHDYHLIPLGAELRKRGVDNPIGFFLHIPFPPGDVFASVSQHEEIAKTLAQYDLVGFQTMKDTAAFLNYVQRHAGGHVPGGGVARRWRSRS